MDHIIDYIRWRGDRSFEQEPFCLNDALVLCQMSYLEERTLPGRGESRTFRAVYEAWAARGEKGASAFGSLEESERLMKAAAESRRFGELVLSDCADEHDREKSLQFAALLFHLDASTVYVAFRGTDDTLDGWKEDFMLSFTETLAQKKARAYLEEQVRPGRRMYVGGHSKGGNLALYAACTCGDEAFESICQVHVLDGPGFCPEVLSTDLIGRADPKTVRLLPEYCLVGRLFDVKLTDTRVVRSDGEGIMQHALTGWGVGPGGPLMASGHTAESVELSRSVAHWLSGVDMEERKKLTEELFEALGRNGETTLSGAVKKSSLESVVLGLMDASADSRRVGMRLGIRLIFEDELDRFHAMGLLEYLSRSRTVRYAALLLFGCALMVSSHSWILGMLAVAAAGMTAAETVLTVKRLRSSGWDFTLHRSRVTLCQTMLLFLAVLLLKKGALEVFGTVLFGFVVVYMGSLILTASREEPGHRGMRIFDRVISNCISLAGFGLLFLPVSGEAPFFLVLGALTAVYALGHFLSIWILRARERRAPAKS